LGLGMAGAPTPLTAGRVDSLGEEQPAAQKAADASVASGELTPAAPKRMKGFVSAEEAAVQPATGMIGFVSADGSAKYTHSKAPTSPLAAAPSAAPTKAPTLKRNAPEHGGGDYGGYGAGYGKPAVRRDPTLQQQQQQQLFTMPYGMDSMTSMGGMQAMMPMGLQLQQVQMQQRLQMQQLLLAQQQQQQAALRLQLQSQVQAQAMQMGSLGAGIHQSAGGMAMEAIGRANKRQRVSGASAAGAHGQMRFVSGGTLQ